MPCVRRVSAVCRLVRVNVSARTTARDLMLKVNDGLDIITTKVEFERTPMTLKFRHGLLLFISLLPLLVAGSCGEDAALPKPSSIKISPEAQSVTVGSPATTFTATVENSTASVLWTLSGAGSLNVTKGPSVNYTPPTSLPTPSTVELTATLEGTTTSDKATITLLANPAAPNLYVNAETGLDTNDGTEDKPFKTITKALSVAVAGQTIVPAVGEARAFSTVTGESFPLRLKSGVNLAPEARIVIGGAGTCLLLENVQDVSLSNLALECDSGISVKDSSEVAMTSVTLVGRSAGFGIAVADSQLTLNKVEARFFRAGLRSTGTSQFTFTGSTFSLNKTGAELGGESDVTADTGNFSENSSEGILVLDGASLTLKNSSLNQNGSVLSPGYGLALNSEQDSNLTIDNSSFDGNNGGGVNVQAGFGVASNFFDVTITNSTFSNNDYGLLVGNAEGIIELRKNTFAFNTTYQISDQRPNTVGSFLFAPETTIDDGMGEYQLSGEEMGPDSVGNVWEISGTTRICFSSCP
jgi:hypothetical protein